MSARLIRSLYNIKPRQQGGVLTIGNFDGVHLGHQELIARTMEKAEQLGVPSVVMTFEPHAFEFFSRDNVTIPRLTRFREKFHGIAACGVDNVLVIPFNQQLAELSAREFVVQVIYEKLKPKHIVVGDDFHFGHKRQGNIALLVEMGQALGFTVEALPTVQIDGERVSSTRVRKVLGEGNLALVGELLDHPYWMQGRVRHGDQRGRTIGFPTANIFLQRHLTPVKGVYVVKMRGLDPARPEKAWPGVANIGQRPTFDGTRTILEVHLLDFNKDIYGRYVEVEFCEKVRDEAKYPNFEALKEQIAKDVQFARDYFTKLELQN